MNNKKLERIASESSMFPYSLPIACFLLLIFLASCSIQKKIAHSASDIIHDPSLQTAHIGISIYEPGTNKYWYEYNGDKYFVPASNTKIPTCYAAMKYLGDSLIGLRYKIKEDNLVEIVPAGDPTFLHPDFKNQPVFRFLRQFKSISILNPLYSDFLGSGWSWNDYKEDYMAQRSSFPIYGNVVKFRWSSEDNIIIEPQIFHASTTVMEKLKTGFEIVKPWDENKFLFMNGSEKNKAVPFRPDILTIVGLLKDTTRLKVDADILGNTANLQELHSQPTDSLLKPMMHRSDNFFAEQSLLMVSNEKLGVMNDEMIIDTLLKTDLKDLPQKPKWVDGSGLSRYNLFSPKDFVAILSKMKDEFGMERIKVILPTGGEGTLSNYYISAKDQVYAKTGSLSGVIALSGYLYTKKNKLLVFSVLVNNHQASASAVRRAVEKFLLGIRDSY